MNLIKSDDEFLEDLPAILANKHKGPRASVSAEAFGVWNKKEEFKPLLVAKSESVKTR